MEKDPWPGSPIYPPKIPQILSSSPVYEKTPPEIWNLISSLELSIEVVTNSSFTTSFNFMSHGSQDLYPTMLTNQFNFSPDAVTVTQVVANLGALTGGTVIGYCSQIFGRRFSIIFISIIGGALLYPYGFTENKKVIAAAFFEQFCVQGAWGVIPIHLTELSPGSFRTFVVGTSYQLGNLVSSASSTIESTIGERYPLPSKISKGKEIKRYRYGKVIAIFMGAVYAYVIFVTLLGPENRGRNLDVQHDEDMEEATHRHLTPDSGSGSDDVVDEKGVKSEREAV